MHHRQFTQFQFFCKLRGYAQSVQFLLEQGQAFAFASQHHDIGRLPWAHLRASATSQAVGQPACGLPRFLHFALVLRAVARHAQGVAPWAVLILLGNCVTGANVFQYLGQFKYAAGRRRRGGVRPKTFKPAIHGQRCEHGIDQLHHALRIAAGMVTAQAVATQLLNNKPFGILKHLGLGTPKAVNALFGVTDYKNRRSPRSPRITANPGLQGLPLQGVGVLKFIDQQVPHLRIQALANPCAAARVRQQTLRGQFQIIHIQPRTLALQGRIVLQ